VGGLINHARTRRFIDLDEIGVARHLGVSILIMHDGRNYQMIDEDIAAARARSRARAQRKPQHKRQRLRSRATRDVHVADDFIG
jgi:hypothetical protein